MKSAFLLSALTALQLLGVDAAVFPKKIYGVNLGSWLLIEPWMLPREWVNMGGQQCSDCSKCIASEFEFAKAFPSTVDQKLNTHWESWFSQSDVNSLVGVGINTVRIPMGYWIVEALVDRSTEFYPKGGIRQLKRGLNQLKTAGIVAILDHHALPGVQTAQQQFTGRCTTNVQFYTTHNYHRALIWTAVMTALSHLDQDFSNVVAIEAVNEPIMDANLTPGYGTFQKQFVQVIRAVEIVLGIPVPGMPAQSFSTSNFTQALVQASSSSAFSQEVRSVLLDTAPILQGVAGQLSLDLFHFSQNRNLPPLVSNFMDINWQHNNPANPADAAIGPQIYDNHLYYSFGGVADPNENAYLTSVCNLDRIQQDANLGNSPLFFGEWGLPTQFTASDSFLRKWADAQKFSYSKGAGWIFWNFKIEISDLAGDTARQWSYLEGVKRGYLTKDPAAMNDPNVCDDFIN
ncbi:glycoside hydrolase family 5 protein [Collybia nuda]|uniref:Glycoside hydrolase family 5 protein n=1 Tax=Collybia nuda TaxID=64659 RepID=A0A9P5YCK3_9AGAR|nr:glycoside hydrolase family 5 protein [Collybia nuda]